MTNFATKKQLSLVIGLITSLMSCSSVTVKTPVDLKSENDDNNSLILIRLAAELDDKLVDTSVAPIRGGLGYAYRLSLTNLATGEAPEPIYPNSDRSATPSKQTKSQGWIYFSATPGDYDLEVATVKFIPPAGNIDFSPKHYRLHIGQDAKVIYGGSFFTKCGGSNFLSSCDAVAPPIDESLVAEAIAKATMANSGPFETDLLQPYSPKLAGEISDLQPIGLVIQQHQGNLISPPWITRGMSRFTGLGDPGRVTSTPDLRGCDQLCAELLMLYTMYLPVGTVMGAIYGKHIEAKWQPCIESLQKELYQYDFAVRLNEAINKAFSAKNVSPPVKLSLTEDPMEEATRLGIKSVIKADIQRIQLRECSINGTFCLEVVLHFSFTDIKSGQVLFGKTLLYSESEAGHQERPNEIRTQDKPACYAMKFYCDSDREVFRNQFMKAMNVMASEILHTLNNQ